MVARQDAGRGRVRRRRGPRLPGGGRQEGVGVRGLAGPLGRRLLGRRGRVGDGRDGQRPPLVGQGRGIVKEFPLLEAGVAARLSAAVAPDGKWWSCRPPAGRPAVPLDGGTSRTFAPAEPPPFPSADGGPRPFRRTAVPGRDRSGRGGVGVGVASGKELRSFAGGRPAAGNFIPGVYNVPATGPATDGKTLVVTGGRVLRFFDLGAGKAIHPAGPEAPIAHLAFLDGGATWSRPAGNVMRAWTPRRASRWGRRRTRRRSWGRSPGRPTASRWPAGGVTRLDWTPGRPAVLTPLGATVALPADLSPDGTLVAFRPLKRAPPPPAGQPFPPQRFDFVVRRAADNKDAFVVPWPTAGTYVSGLGFSRDGRFVYAVESGGTVRIRAGRRAGAAVGPGAEPGRLGRAGVRGRRSDLRRHRRRRGAGGRDGVGPDAGGVPPAFLSATAALLAADGRTVYAGTAAGDVLGYDLTTAAFAKRVAGHKAGSASSPRATTTPGWRAAATTARPWFGTRRPSGRRRRCRGRRPRRRQVVGRPGRPGRRGPRRDAGDGGRRAGGGPTAQRETEAGDEVVGRGDRQTGPSWTTTASRCGRRRRARVGRPRGDGQARAGGGGRDLDACRPTPASGRRSWWPGCRTGRRRRRTCCGRSGRSRRRSASARRRRRRCWKTRPRVSTRPRWRARPSGRSAVEEVVPDGVGDRPSSLPGAVRRQPAGVRDFVSGAASARRRSHLDRRADAARLPDTPLLR